MDISSKAYRLGSDEVPRDGVTAVGSPGAHQRSLIAGRLNVTRRKPQNEQERKLP